MNPNRKYILTDERRAFLKEHYGRITAKEVALHALFRGIPRWRICHWACDLHLTKVAKPWSKQEQTYLEAHYHRMSVSDIAKRLGCSQSRVVRRCEQIGLRKNTLGYTLLDVAMGLGCSEELLLKWIAMGWLTAQKRAVERTDKRAPWYISESAIRSLVRSHPEHINQHKVNWLWLMDVIFDGIGELSSVRGNAEQEAE